jgi:hypothetical protein
MANPKGNPQYLNPYPPGVSGNPLGVSKIAAQSLLLRQTEYAEFLSIFHTCGRMTDEDFDAWIKDKARVKFEKAVGLLVDQASKGDKLAFTILVERLFGKVKDISEVMLKRDWNDEFKKFPRENVLTMLAEIAKEKQNPEG